VRVAPLIGAAVALLAVTACGGCTAKPGFTVRQGAALSPATAPGQAAAGAGLRVLHVGDFGERTPQQRAVADAVVAAHVRAPFALALFAGDLIYPCGPDALRPGAETCAFAPDGVTVATPPGGAPDPAFATLHEEPLARLLASTPPRPVMTLGNHDVWVKGTCTVLGLDAAVAARRKACLAVAHSSALWSLPGRHFTIDEGPARFVVLDSNVLYADYGGFTLDDELRFLDGALAGCESRACFVLLHHPPTTSGEHESDFGTGHPERLERVRRLEAVAGHRVRAFLAGHDHDLQHLRTSAGVDVLVSGNGATGRPEERFGRTSGGGSLLFASTAWGLGVLTVRQQGWDYRFEDDRGAPLYCCAATAAGPCQPITCTPGSPEGRAVRKDE
jgi:hypothetical protein